MQLFYKTCRFKTKNGEKFDGFNWTIEPLCDMIILFEIPVKQLRKMARVWVRFARWTYEAKLLRRRASP